MKVCLHPWNDRVMESAEMADLNLKDSIFISAESADCRVLGAGPKHAISSQNSGA